jgi:hypothetical protein
MGHQAIVRKGKEGEVDKEILDVKDKALVILTCSTTLALPP